MKRSFFTVKILLCLLVALPALSGCLRRPVAVPPPVKPVEELAGYLAAAAERFQSLRGEARLRLESGEQNLSVTQVLLVQRPGSLRSETLNPLGFGSSLMVVAADGERLAVSIPTQGAFYQGESSPANLARFTQLPLRLEDLVGILLSDVPRFPFTHAVATVADGRDRLDLSSEGGVRQLFSFDSAGRLVEAALLIEDETRLRIAYGEFGAVDAFPRTMTLTMPPRKVEVTLRFTDVTVNQLIPPEKFKLSPPKGVKVQSLPKG